MLGKHCQILMGECKIIVNVQTEMRTVLRISWESDSGVSAFLRRSRIGMNARIRYWSELQASDQ